MVKHRSCQPFYFLDTCHRDNRMTREGSLQIHLRATIQVCVFWKGKAWCSFMVDKTRNFFLMVVEAKSLRWRSQHIRSLWRGSLLVCAHCLLVSPDGRCMWISCSPETAQSAFWEGLRECFPNLALEICTRILKGLGSHALAFLLVLGMVMRLSTPLQAFLAFADLL